MKTNLGRPKKYDTETTVLSATVPFHLKAYVEDYAIETGCNRSEAVVMLLQSSDKEMATNMINFLRENIKLQTALFSNKINNVKDLYDKIEIDPNVKKFTLKYKNRFMSSKKVGLNERLDIFVDIIYPDFENYMLSKGQTIRRKNLIKHNIRMVLLKLGD